MHRATTVSDSLLRGCSLSLLALAAAVVVLAAACGEAHPTDQTDARSAPAGLSAGLPSLSELPAGPAAPRESSVAPQQRNGAAFEQASATVFQLDDSAFFTPPEGHLNYALYRFDLGAGDDPAQLTLQIGELIGPSFYVGISNYAQGVWNFHQVTQFTTAVDLSASAGAYSNGASMYVVVINTAGNMLTLDGLTLSFPAEPFPGWLRTWGSGEGDNPTHITMDPAGNVYLVGTYGGTDGAGSTDDGLAFIKYSPTGALLASRTFYLNAPGLFPSSLFPSSMIQDAAGNIYVQGNLSYHPDDDGLANNDIFMLKLDSGLNVQWVRRLRRDQSEGLADMCFDHNGDIVAAGSFSVTPGGPSFLPLYLRISQAGAYLEGKVVGSVEGRLRRVSVDPDSGDIFMTGTAAFSIAGDPAMVRISEGAVAWHKYWTNVSGQQGLGVAYDGAGGATMLVSESPSSRYASPHQEPLFVTVDADGELVAGQVFAAPSVRSFPSYLSVTDGVAKIFAPSLYTGSGAPEDQVHGTLIYSFPVGDLAALEGTLWTAEASVFEDFATNGTATAFMDGSSWPSDQILPSPQPMFPGSFQDITDTVTLGNITSSLTDFGGEFTEELDWEMVDTPGQQDLAPADNPFRTTYHPGA